MWIRQCGVLLPSGVSHLSISPPHLCVRRMPALSMCSAGGQHRADKCVPRLRQEGEGRGGVAVLLLPLPLPALCDAPVCPSHHGCSAESPVCARGGDVPARESMSARTGLFPALSAPHNRADNSGLVGVGEGGVADSGLSSRDFPPPTWRPMWITVSDRLS